MQPARPCRSRSYLTPGVCCWLLCSSSVHCHGGRFAMSSSSEAENILCDDDAASMRQRAEVRQGAASARLGVLVCMKPCVRMRACAIHCVYARLVLPACACSSISCTVSRLRNGCSSCMSHTYDIAHTRTRTCGPTQTGGQGRAQAQEARQEGQEEGPQGGRGEGCRRGRQECRCCSSSCQRRQRVGQRPAPTSSRGE